MLSFLLDNSELPPLHRRLEIHIEQAPCVKCSLLLSYQASGEELRTKRYCTFRGKARRAAGVRMQPRPSQPRKVLSPWVTATVQLSSKAGSKRSQWENSLEAPDQQTPTLMSSRLQTDKLDVHHQRGYPKRLTKSYQSSLDPPGS